MSRIAKGDVNAALQHVAQNLIQAGGDDSRISRADVKQHLQGLQGTEKALTDIFFRFIDHRDHVHGATVTPKDIEKAIEYSKEKLVAKYDLNNNGLSKAEIAKMSTTGKLAVQLSKELKQVEESSPADNGALLAKSFESSAEGLWYTSESDYPYEGVHFPGAAGEQGGFDADKLKEALGLPAGQDFYSVESGEEFFQRQADSTSPGEFAQYKALQDEMGANLRDLKYIQVDGEDQVEGRVLLVGTAEDGSLVGLQTTRIWT